MFAVDTATEGGDYTVDGATLNFDPADATESVGRGRATLTALDDDVFEAPDETVVTVSGAVSIDGAERVRHRRER